MSELKTYLVGGAVRDQLLGLPQHDRDYVVIGETPEGMLARGFQRVGSDFPVFLHPKTREEYALARTERKSGSGHTGFTVDANPMVTLEQDLARRDLTINAMALDPATGELIDPFDGFKDLQSRTLRHVSDAFMEDPLRILRLFRFAAKFGPSWQIAPETKALVSENLGSLAELPAERKWGEFVKALKSDGFAIYIRHLIASGELPELADLFGIPQPPQHHPEGCAFTHVMRCLEECDWHAVDPQVKFAVLCHDFGKSAAFRRYGNLHGHEELGLPAVKALCDRLKVPNEYRELAYKVTEYHTKLHSLLGRPGQKGLKPATVMRFIESLGYSRRPEQLAHFVSACRMDAYGRGEPGSVNQYPQGDAFLTLVPRVAAINSADVTIGAGWAGELVGQAIRGARIAAIRAFFNALSNKE